MKCDFYHEMQKQSSVGNLFMQGFCGGTKESAYCWCDGDRARCTYYPSIRKAALEERRATMTKAEAEKKFNIKIVEDKSDEQH